MHLHHPCSSAGLHEPGRVEGRRDFRNLADEASGDMMHSELLYIPRACCRDGLTKSGLAIEAKDAVGERFGTFGLDQNAAANDFGNGRGARGDNWLSRGHGFQKGNAEAFLNTWQAEDIGAIVFGGELPYTGIANPPEDAFQAQFG
jgi:hypothetical protein